MNVQLSWSVGTARTLRPLAIAGFAALLLSTAGAFDTEASRFGPRLLYWSAIACVSALALQLVHGALSGHFDRLGSYWLRLFGWLILTLPLNALAVLGCKLLFGGSPSLGGFLLLLPGMTTILAALQATLLTLEQPGEQAGEKAGPCERVAAEPPRPGRSVGGTGLGAFLPLPLQGSRLLALRSEDHYLRVHTDKGEALIRLRMTDALAMLDGRCGLRPHRSWWVATDAILSHRREGGRSVLRLVDGTSVPVSRNRRSEVGPIF